MNFAVRLFKMLQTVVSTSDGTYERPIRVGLFNDTTNDHHWGCDIVISEIDRRMNALGAITIWRHNLDDDWRRDPAITAGSLEVDVALVNGEGTIHHTANRNKRGAILSEVGPYAKAKLRVPAFLINAGIHEVDKLTAENLRSFDRIFVRDFHSKSELAKFGVSACVVPDLTVCGEYSCELRRQGVLGTDSVIPEVAAAIAERSAAEGWPYKPIVYDRMTVKGEANAERYVQLLSSHQLVVTGRFHVAALCLATQTPVVAVESNTPKISSLLRDALLSTKRLIPREELAKFNPADFISWSNDENELLDCFLQSARTRAADMFRRIFAPPRRRLRRPPSGHAGKLSC